MTSAAKRCTTSVSLMDFPPVALPATGRRGCVGLDAEHFGHDPLELDLDMLWPHPFVGESLPQPCVALGRAGVAAARLGIGVCPLRVFGGHDSNRPVAQADCGRPRL